MSLKEIAEDWQVFAREGTVGVGAVRKVHPARLVVYIEGYGEIDVTAAQIAAAHDGKVILALDEMEPAVQNAILHAHDRETR
ncbi:MAG: hypothetical protein AAFM92_13940 [Pseudomonadota bacterium]